MDDRPPLRVTLFNGLQHVGIIAINLIYPVVIFKMAGVPVEATINLLSVGMLVLGVGAFIQCVRSPVGSGYLCPTTFTATYFGASVLAVKAGGLPLLFGMTLFAGMVEVLLSRLLKRLRAFLPTELSGLVLLMIGIAAGIAGMRTLFNADGPPLGTADWIVMFGTLGTMCALNVWGKGALKMLCALIGLIAGYAMAAGFGQFGSAQFAGLANAPWFALPQVVDVSWSFDTTLAVTFAIAALAATMKATGTIAMCQRTNDAAWARPEPRSVARGVLGDGLTTALAGLAGTFGTNTSTPSVGVASATGVASRHVGYAAGIVFLSLGFMPKVAAMLAIMPRPVMAAGLLFAACFIIVNGLQVMASRLLDIRRTLTIGLAVVAGVTVDIFPAVVANAPGALAPLLASSLAFATVIALGLNLLFRIGVKQTVTLAVEREALGTSLVSDFLRQQGATWGARGEIVARASFAANQLVEAVADNGWREGPLTLTVSFDEFNLDLRASYSGEPLPFPTQRPTPQEIIESPDGASRFAGFMLRHNADRVRSEARGTEAHILFHFDH